MHPVLSVPVADSMGWPTEWKYDRRTIPKDQVLHVADISWTSGVSMILGETVIRSLHDVLTTVMQAQEAVRIQSARGRPEIIFSPKAEVGPISPEAIRRISEGWEKFTQSKKGAYIAGAPFDYQLMNLSSREMEFRSREDAARDTTLAVFEVPPTRAGLPGANYGTAKTAMRQYWESLLNGMGSLFEDEWSTLTGDRDRRIEHDRSNIEALQVSRTDRQNRAEKWVNVFGADPAEATNYEGFRGAPVGNATGVQTRPAKKEPDEPQGTQRSSQALQASLHAYLQRSAARYERRVMDADGNPDAIPAHDEESLRTLVVLEGHGVPAPIALRWADDIAGVSDEAARGVATEAWGRGVTRAGLDALDAFGSARADQLAAAITMEAA